ncbi:alpha/beta fold hydrolase [Nonomuraea sp. NPDC050556]|uniref:alpha/beta fold hydrolase n=1 Tax=Nonomuraea sp. NPDC050556 TaxID=3364369 RepID=UPI00379738E9
MNATFVLLHSPLVGPSTWAPVAALLSGAVVPDLRTAPPYWPQVVSAAVRQAPSAGALVLVAHSNAGLLVPAIANALGGRVRGCVFVDAHVPPRSGSVPATDPAHLPFLRSLAGPDDVLPRWTDWWDPSTMRLPPEVVAEQPRLPLDYFTQRIPVPAGWDRVACRYVWFSPPYEPVAKEAEARGWPVTHLPGHHLQQLDDPSAVAREVVNSSLP